MKKFYSLVVFLTLASLILAACGSGETFARPDSYDVAANGGNPVYYPPAKCGTTPSTGGIVFCYQDVADGTTLIGLDAALVGSFATPLPDEYIVAVAWGANKAVKIFIALAALAALNEGVEYTVHEVVNGRVVEIQEAWEPHNKDHNIDRNIPAVTAMITAYETWKATGGPNQPGTNGNFTCRVLKVAGKIVEYVLWSKDGKQLLVYGSDGGWTTYYPGKEYNTLMNPPKKYRSRGGKMETFSCNDLPPFPPMPAGA